MDSSKPDVQSENELPKRLMPLLEIISNLHYLLDVNVTNPEKLKYLRGLEDEAFDQIFALVNSFPEVSRG